MITLKTESKIIKEKPFLSVSQFKNRIVTLPNEIIEHNSIVKGIRRSGKTDKVLIPAFEMCKNGILYVDYNHESEDILKKIAEKNNRTLHIFYNKDVNIQRIIQYIIKGHIVYFNVRQGKENDIEYLNSILNGIAMYSSKIEDSINILIDNVQYLGKLDSFEHIISNCENIKILMTLCYTRQLESFYGEETIKLIKESFDSYDVEKQQE